MLRRKIRRAKAIAYGKTRSLNKEYHENGKKAEDESQDLVSLIESSWRITIPSCFSVCSAQQCGKCWSLFDRFHQFYLWTARRRDQEKPVGSPQVTRLLARTLSCLQRQTNRWWSDESCARYSAIQWTYDLEVITRRPRVLLWSELNGIRLCLSRYVLTFLSDPTGPTWLGIFYAILLGTTVFCQTLFLQAYFHRQFVVGIRFRSAVTGLIYRKVSLELINVFASSLWASRVWDCRIRRSKTPLLEKLSIWSVSLHYW